MRRRSLTTFVPTGNWMWTSSPVPTPLLTSLEAGKLCFQDEHQRDFVHGNIKARARMMAQYTVAGSYNGLVVGTDHGAEAVTGFFTKHGDGACDTRPWQVSQNVGAGRY